MAAPERHGGKHEKLKKCVCYLFTFVFGCMCIYLHTLKKYIFHRYLHAILVFVIAFILEFFSWDSLLWVGEMNKIRNAAHLGVIILRNVMLVK